MLYRIIIESMRSGVDDRLRKEEAGYRKGRGATVQVFILRNFIEQVNKWQATLYLNFIDFEMVFKPASNRDVHVICQVFCC